MSVQPLIERYGYPRAVVRRLWAPEDEPAFLEWLLPRYSPRFAHSPQFGPGVLKSLKRRLARDPDLKQDLIQYFLVKSDSQTVVGGVGVVFDDTGESIWQRHLELLVRRVRADWFAGDDYEHFELFVVHPDTKVRLEGVLTDSVQSLDMDTILDWHQRAAMQPVAVSPPWEGSIFWWAGNHGLWRARQDFESSEVARLVSAEILREKEEAISLQEHQKREKADELAWAESVVRGESPAVRARQGRETIPPSTQKFVWSRDGGRCVSCGSQVRLEFDHVVPIGQGGSNTARNLQLLCESCNRSKGSRIGG